MNINFISEVRGFKIPDTNKLRKWISNVIEKEKFRIGKIIFTIVDKEKITTINKIYLKHDYPTDIITFDKSYLNFISGEIFICADMVIDNAKKYTKGDTIKELYRVIIHGVLHLIGYNDRVEKEKQMMRKKENELLIYLETL